MEGANQVEPQSKTLSTMTIRSLEHPKDFQSTQHMLHPSLWLLEGLVFLASLHPKDLNSAKVEIEPS